MIRRFCLAVPALATLATPAFAASFDCSKAATPFEKAICQNEALSLADETMAKAFATAVGGLTKDSVASMRADQRSWLDYAQRACTDDAKPVTAGSYDADASACLVDLFKTRATTLEDSRMLGGHRFLLKSVYSAMPDPDEVNNPESYWKVATHEAAIAMMDSDDPLAEDFNAWVVAQSADYTDMLKSSGGGGVRSDLNPSADTVVTMAVHELGGTNRITLEVSTFWYGHGAAHGEYNQSYLHYYVPEHRSIVAEDIFTGDNWQDVLASVAWELLQTQHNEWLQAESKSDILEAVTDPTRWDLGNDYDLVIQFQPYEVAAYAYGAPTVTIPWERLESIKAPTQDDMRYGW